MEQLLVDTWTVLAVRCPLPGKLSPSSRVGDGDLVGYPILAPLVALLYMGLFIGLPYVLFGMWVTIAIAVPIALSILLRRYNRSKLIVSVR